MKLVGHKEEFDGLLGFEKAGQLAHAYLFAGIEGIGKKLFAFEFAKALFCLHPSFDGRPCGNCRNCQRVDHGNHPDLFFVARLEDKKDIIIDQTRDLQSQVQMSPIDGKYKIVIIDDSEKMNGAAANSLLKILEEPPKATVFFLLTSRLHMLLPTIVSRCQKVFFHPPPEEDSIRLIKQLRSIDNNLARLLFNLTGGSIGSSLVFPVEVIDETLTAMKGLWQKTSPKEITALAEKWGKNEDVDPGAVLSVLLSIYRDMLLFKTTGKQTAFETIRPDLEKKAYCLSISSINRCFNAIQSAQRDIEETYNKQLMFEQLLFTLAP